MTTRLFRPLALLWSVLMAAGALADLNDGLVLHYTFDANEGGVVTDWSPLGNNGVVNGGTWLEHGRVKGAMNFDGNDYIRVPRSASLEPGAITIALWVRMAQLDGAAQQCLVFKKSPNTFNHEDYYLGWYHPEGWFNLGLTDPSAQSCSAHSSSPVAAGTWCHVVVTFAQPDVRLYLNGRLEGQDTHDTPLYHDVTRDLLIGVQDHALDPLYNYLHGDLDDVRIYNRALSADEALALYEQAGPLSDFWTSRIGFSDTASGDQDVTEFVNDETLHIYVNDVDLDASDPDVVVWVDLKGKALNKKGKPKSYNVQQVLAPLPDGGFSAQIPLNQFLPGTVDIGVYGVSGPGKSADWLGRESQIVINPVP